MRQPFQSRMSREYDSVKDVWEQGQEIPYQSIGDVHFIQKCAEPMCAGYAILKWFSDPMRFRKTLLKIAGLLSNLDKILLQTFMEGVHSACTRKESPKWFLNDMPRGLTLNSEIKDQIRGVKRRELPDTRRWRRFRWITWRVRRVWSTDGTGYCWILVGDGFRQRYHWRNRMARSC